MEETEKNIQQLQLLEQNIQNFVMQKQQLQMQIVEIDSALEEVGKTKEAYKIVGNIMVSAESVDLKKDLESRKQLIELRVKSMEKQENELKDKEKILRESVLKNMKKK